MRMQCKYDVLVYVCMYVCMYVCTNICTLCKINMGHFLVQWKITQSLSRSHLRLNLKMRLDATGNLRTICRLQIISFETMKLDELKRARVIGLAAQGYAIPEIIRQTRFSRKFVRTWSGRTSLRDRPGRGRPVKLTRPVISRVRGLMKVSRFLASAPSDLVLNFTQGKKRRSTRRALSCVNACQRTSRASSATSTGCSSRTETRSTPASPCKRGYEAIRRSSSRKTTGPPTLRT